MFIRSGIITIVLLSSTVSAQEIEIQEGLPEHLMYMEAPVSGDANQEGQSQHIGGRRTWPPGQALKVCFFGGDEVVRQLIAGVATEWSAYANLTFDFGPPGNRYDCTAPQSGFSHIRVGFSEKGYWSLVGTDSVKKANQYQTSMNLSNYDMEYSAFNGFTLVDVVARAAPLRKATILHEFGHAIGLLHEHQNKNLDCWNEVIKEGENSVYKYFAKPPNEWRPEKVERNLGPALLYDPDSVSGTADSKSIMMYLIPASVLRGGTSNKCYIASKNLVISDLDKNWVAQYYPMNVADIGTDEDLAQYTIVTLPPGASSELSQDFLDRIRVDLNSGVTAVRRDARSRLAEFLKTSDLQTLESLISDLSQEPYRTQLGVAVALSKAGNIVLPDASLAELQRTLEKTTNKELIVNLGKVLK